jgi:hypothetical protein
MFDFKIRIPFQNLQCAYVRYRVSCIMKTAYKNHCNFHAVAPGSRVPLDNLTIVKVDKIPSLYVQPTLEFIMIFRTAHHWIPSCATLIHSMSSSPVSFRPTLILSYHQNSLLINILYDWNWRGWAWMYCFYLNMSKENINVLYVPHGRALKHVEYLRDKPKNAHIFSLRQHVSVSPVIINSLLHK